MSTATTPAPRRSWRGVRVGVAASSSLCVALLGHVAGGGTAPRGPALAVAVVAAAAFASVISRHRWTVRTLTALVVGVQGGVHLWCVVATPSGPTGAAGSSGAMLVGHALATAVTVALLKRGEDALQALGEVLLRRPARRLAFAGGGPSLVMDVEAAVVEAVVPRLHTLLLGAALRRRGPPVRA